MSQPLIETGQLIKDTWHAFIKTWDTTVRYSAWIILMTVLMVIPLFMPEDNWPLLSLSIILTFAGVAIGVWVSVRLLLVVLALERKEKITEKTTEPFTNLVWPYVFASILSGLATLGGFILLVIPGIYIGIRLAFAQIAAVDAKKQAVEACKLSWEITKNRFWAVFGRQLAGGIVFGFLVLVVFWVAVTLVSLISNIDFAAALQDEETANPAVVGTFNIIQGVLEAAFLPLFFIFQAKLY